MSLGFASGAVVGKMRCFCRMGRLRREPGWLRARAHTSQPPLSVSGGRAPPADSLTYTDLSFTLPSTSFGACPVRTRQPLESASVRTWPPPPPPPRRQARHPAISSRPARSPRSPSCDDFDPAASARQILSELRPPPTRSACLARSLAAQSECPSVSALRRRRSRRGQRPQSLHALTSRPADHTTRPDSAKVGRSPLRRALGVIPRRQIGS
jgi:hypothetical protein